MDELEVHLLALPVEHAGGAVRLVGDGEGEGRCLREFLGLGDPHQRLVGAEDDLRVARGLELGGDLLGPRDDRAFKLGDPDVLLLVLAAGVGVGADDERAQRSGRVGQPLPTRLGDERDGRGQEQDGAAVRHEALRDPQRGERLAGAAGHDEPPAVVMPETPEHVLDRFLLQRPRLTDRTFDLIGDRPAVVVAEVDPADVRPLDDALRHPAPAACGDDPAQPEGLVL